MNNPEIIDQEFKPSIGSKLFFILLALCLLVFAIYFSSLQWRGGIKDKLIALPPMFFLSIFIIVQTCFKKLIITGDSIIYKTLFRTKVLAITAVEGFRSGVRYIKLEPATPGISAITFDYSSFPQSEDILPWVRNHFTDLDAIDLAEEKRAFEECGDGLTAEQKKRQLQNAGTVANAYNAISFITSFIAVIARNAITDGIKLLIPIAGLAIMLFSRKMIRFVPAWGKSIYPAVGFGILMPSVFLFLNAADRYNWIGTVTMLINTTLLAMAFAWFVYKVGWNNLIRPKWTQAFFIGIVTFFFAFGAVTTINCSFDASQGKTYYSKILDKENGRDSAGAYYLFTIAPWQNGYGERDVRVGSKLYYNREPSQTLEVIERNGLLGIHWFTVQVPEDNLIKTKQ